MKKALVVMGIVLIMSLLLFTACKPKETEPEIEPETLYNETLNEEIENLTTIEQPELEDTFEEFMFEWEPRNESKYEIAEEDIFTTTMGNFTSTEISFFGVMLGDSYEYVIERLGIPDVTFIPSDESYMNLEYKNKIGIGGKFSGLTFHIKDDAVARITVKPAFLKYMHGNTSVGTDKDMIYAVLDIPDYQDFYEVFRIFHYVEKGVELYFKNRYINRMSFIPPIEFKGVEYITTPELLQQGVVVNTTKTVIIE